MPDYVWEFQKQLRLFEYYKNCKKGKSAELRCFFIERRFKRLSLKLGFNIPINVFGPGLSIAHYGTITVSRGAKIGANCRIHTSVNIGTQAGYRKKAPTIGNNCYIGPGVKIYGDIILADGIAIGANAVVNKSFDERHIAIAGIPAKRIREVDTTYFLIPATEIMEKGLNIDESYAGISARGMKNRLHKERCEKI
jgi:serine O-acetyltransferase